jgi:hypothetical protein
MNEEASKFEIRGFLRQIRRILKEYRVDRKRMKKGHILP